MKEFLATVVADIFLLLLLILLCVLRAVKAVVVAAQITRWRQLCVDLPKAVRSVPLLPCTSAGVKESCRCHRGL